MSVAFACVVGAAPDRRSRAARRQGRGLLPQPEPDRQREPVQDRHHHLAGLRLQPQPRRLHDQDQRRPRRRRDPEDRPQRPGLPDTRPSTSTSTGWATTTATAAGSSTAPPTSRSTTTSPANRWTQTTGEVDCGNWSPTYTIPGSAFPASGVYLAKLTASTGEQTQVIFTVRDDDRQPTRRSSTSCRSPPTRPTTSSAASPSTSATSKGTRHTRSPAPTAPSRSPSTAPSTAPAAMHELVPRPRLRPALLDGEAGLRRLLHRRRRTSTTTPASCSTTTADVISGHSEYWSAAAVQRLPGRPRSRRQHRLLQRQHRLLEGPLRGRQPHPRLLQDGRGQRLRRQRHGQPERLGPGRDQRHRRRRPRARRHRRHRRRQPAELDHDLPRQRRAPRRPQRAARRPRRPRHAREPALRASCTSATTTPQASRSRCPPRNANGRIRRRPDLAQHRHLREHHDQHRQPCWSTGSGTRSRPRPSTSRTSRQRGQAARPRPTSRRPSDNSWIQDEGRAAQHRPPPGQPGTVGAVTLHRAPAAPWSSPAARCSGRAGSANEPDARIQQATYNIFSDMGVQPDTPDEDLTLDPGGSNQAAQRRLHDLAEPGENLDRRSPSTPRPRTTPTAPSPNTNGTSTATAASRPTPAPKPTRHPQLRGRGRTTTCACGSPTTAAPPTSPCARSTIIDNQPPTAELHGNAAPSIVKGEPITFNGSASSDPDGTIAKYEWDFDGNGSYETSGGANADRSATPTPRRAPTRSACG